MAFGSTPEGVTSTMQLNTADSGPARIGQHIRSRAAGEAAIACEGASIFEDDHGYEGDVIQQSCVARSEFGPAEQLVRRTVNI